ncbi:hypothetical protein MJG53_000113 [Ovis ammon polii x Ovis aries]|nr:hypothetical protein MJG53_000113 [Ovis ammon polii x Ovis aries]
MNSHGDWPFLRPPERVPEGPVVEMRDPFAACSGENPGRSRRIARRGALHRKGLGPRHRRKRKPERTPSNSDGDGPVLRPPERVPKVPVVEMRDPFAACSGENPGRSRRIARRGALHRKGLGPRHRRKRKPERTPSNSDGDGPVLRPPERVPKVPVVEMRDPFAACSGENPGRSRRIARRGALHRKGESNSSVVPPFQESPRCLSPFRRNLFSVHCDFHAEDRLPPQSHVGQPCGKASWESLEGKPQIP